MFESKLMIICIDERNEIAGTYGAVWFRDLKYLE